MTDDFEVLEKIERGGRVFRPSGSSDMSRDAKDLGEYKSKGRRETLEHLFICHVDRDGKIDDITSNADLFRPIETPA
jgi:hypothetical protein